MSLTSFLKNKEVKEAFRREFKKPRSTLRAQLLKPPLTDLTGCIHTTGRVRSAKVHHCDKPMHVDFNSDPNNCRLVLYSSIDPCYHPSFSMVSRMKFIVPLCRLLLPFQ